MTTLKDDNERADMTNSNNFKENTGIAINDLDHYKPKEGKAESDESTRKDPTFDEYHNMKGEEDDDSKQNFTIELRSFIRPTWNYNQIMPVLSGCIEGSGGPEGVFHPTNLLYVSFFFQNELSFISVVFEILMYNFSITIMTSSFYP